jgi:hypothetical protein
MERLPRGCKRPEVEAEKSEAVGPPWRSEEPIWEMM